MCCSQLDMRQRMESQTEAISCIRKSHYSWSDPSAEGLNPQITVVIFTIAHPLALVSSMLWLKLRGRKQDGAIRLPEDEEEEGAGGRPRGPREVDAEALWG